MIRLLTAVLLVASFDVVAEVCPPFQPFPGALPTRCYLNQFNNNEVADADEVMENFNTLADAIDAAKPPLNCSINQIIRWNGTAWACTDDPFANLSCSAGDTLTYDGSAFTCDSVCVPPGTAITDSNFKAAIDDWFANGNESEYGDITKWCTGAVTDMSDAFRDRHDFNADIGDWDTSSVTDMSFMFIVASTFNQDIGGWDVSNVTDMRYMFANAYAFNQDIGGWDTRSLETMAAMFVAAWTFNQDIVGWDVSNVTEMSQLFQDAEAFNQDIGGWDTGNVTNMAFMFREADAFNQDLSSWDALSLQECRNFAPFASAWLNAYGGSIAGKTPPLSASMIAAGCGQ